jgi:Fe-S cluster biogenesis protein NfuA
MGLWDTLRSKLGFPRPLVVRDPGAPLTVSEAARAALQALPPGQGIHLQTVPAERGRLVQVLEGESQGPPPEPLQGLPVTLSDADLALLRGRVLDRRDDRWVVTIPLELRARETPNPEGRLYLSDQVLCLGRPAFFVSDFTPGEPDQPDLAVRLLAVRGVRSILLRDNTLTVEREPDHPWPEIDAGIDIALREHLLLCGPPEGPLSSSNDTDSIESQIRAVVAEKLLPAIHRDGGDLEVIGYSAGVVKVSMVGACRTCPSSSLTLRLGVEKTLKEAFPGKIERVETV